MPVAGTGPPFPVAVLPRWLREFVVGVAGALQVPSDLPALLALSVVAVAVARKAAVRVWDGWVEPLNIYTVTVLPPGEGKSPAFAEAVRPLEAWEAMENERLRPVVEEALTRRGILEARAKHAKELAAKAGPLDRAAREEEAHAAARALSACIVPTLPRLIAEDVTPEKLASLLHEQHGRMAVLSDEGGIFELMAGRYSANGAPNLEVFLKGHPGMPLRVDRATRPSDFVQRPALTMALTVQPDVLNRLRGIPELRGRGLLGRFFYALPASRLGQRDVYAPPLSQTVRDQYAARISGLLDLPPARDAAEWPAPTSTDDVQPEPTLLKLSPPALEQFQAFRASVEAALKPSGTLRPIADWASKLSGGVARLAGLLHMADLVDDDAEAVVEIVKVVDRSLIPGPTTERAIALGRYLTDHALVAFRAMGQDPAFAGAQRVLAWLRERRPKLISRRELHRVLAGTFPRVADLLPALDLLVEYGYLRAHEVQKPGRRPSTGFLVNPRLYDNLDDLDNRSEPEPRRGSCRGCRDCQ